MHGHRYQGSPEFLRSPQRMAILQTEQVVSMCLSGQEITSVLDVGTGAGIFAEEFTRHSLQVAGVDVNPDMVAAARHYVPQAVFSQASAECLPFDDNSYDLVFMAHVLHEADDALSALKEARRVAKHTVAVLEWPYEQGNTGPPLEHRISPAQLRDLSQQAGCRQISSVRLEHLVLYLLTPDACRPI